MSVDNNSSEKKKNFRLRHDTDFCFVYNMLSWAYSAVLIVFLLILSLDIMLYKWCS